MKTKKGFGESGQSAYRGSEHGPSLRERVRLGEGGRFVIPAIMREQMGVGPGDALLLRVDEDGELHVIGRQQAIRRIQREAARLKKPGESIVDEFIAEKRAEAARE